MRFRIRCPLPCGVVLRFDLNETREPGRPTFATCPVCGELVRFPAPQTRTLAEAWSVQPKARAS